MFGQVFNERTLLERESVNIHNEYSGRQAFGMVDGGHTCKFSSISSRVSRPMSLCSTDSAHTETARPSSAAYNRYRIMLEGFKRDNAMLMFGRRSCKPERRDKARDRFSKGRQGDNNWDVEVEGDLRPAKNGHNVADGWEDGGSLSISVKCRLTGLRCIKNFTNLKSRSQVSPTGLSTPHNA